CGRRNRGGRGGAGRGAQTGGPPRAGAPGWGARWALPLAGGGGRWDRGGRRLDRGPRTGTGGRRVTARVSAGAQHAAPLPSRNPKYVSCRSEDLSLVRSII